MARVSKWLTDVSAHDPTSVVARRTLEVRLAGVERYLPLAARKADKDDEYVHQLRVSTRRAMAALRLYEDFLPRRRAKWFRRQLKRLRRAAGDARDLDVLFRRLESSATDDATHKLLAAVRTRRVAAQRPLLRAYSRMVRGDRLKRKVTGLLQRIRVRPGRTNAAGDPPFAVWAADRMREITAQFFGASPTRTDDPEALHRFRIQTKHLRYAMELLAAAFDADFRQVIYPVVEEIQSKLGEINDHVTAQGCFRDWIDRAASESERGAWQRLLADEQQGLAAAVQSFSSWWTAERQRHLREKFDAVMCASGSSMAG